MKYREKIVELRSKGYSYRQIEKELGCSRGTITYHLTTGLKEKTKLRNKKIRQKNHPFVAKYYHFLETKKLKPKKSKVCDFNKLLYCKVRVFHRGEKVKDFNFKPEDVINKYGENTFCYLTGDRIDISKPRTYSFDHKIPRSRGGENTLDNLGICTKIVNTSKTDMTPEEYIELCKKVLEHNGYNVTKSV
jgi:5-methylcytosine-specific restriction endonuclease McrA